MLAEDACDQPGNMRRRKAVSGRTYGLATEPCDLEVDPRGTEFDGWGRVIFETEWIAPAVGCNRENRRVWRRIARRPHIVHRADDHGLFEVRGVGDLVEQSVVVDA